MKKFLCGFLAMLISAPMVGCFGGTNPQSTPPESKLYALTLVNAEEYLLEPLESAYEAGEQVDFSTCRVLDAQLKIYLNGDQIMQTAWGATWSYVFTMPKQDSVLEFKVESSNPLYGEKMSDYVQIEDVKLPDRAEYYACEMQETDSSIVDELKAITTIAGRKNESDFEYGRLIVADLPSEDTYIWDSLLERNTYRNEELKNVEHYHYKSNEQLQFGKEDRETFQYRQTVNEKGYSLSEVQTALNAGKFSMEWDEYNSNTLDYTPRRFVLLTHETTSISYKKGEKEGVTYYEISGTYVDEQALVYNQCQSEIVYVVKDSAIVSWYYHNVATSLEEEGVWEDTIYCKLYDGEIDMVDEEILADVAKRYQEGV